MVFNKSFDNTLWLMITSDRKNRYDVAKLISSIPYELFEKIRDLLYCETFLETKKISKAVRDSFGNTYLFNIYISDMEIRIELSKWGLSDDCEESYELDLKPVSFNEEMVNESLDSTYVGSYFWKITKPIVLFNEVVVVTKCNMLSYELLNIINKNVIIRLSGEKDYCRNISLVNIPDDINLSDLSDNKRVNRLIRGRMRKRL